MEKLSWNIKLTQHGSSFGHVSCLPGLEDVPGDVSQHDCSPHDVKCVDWLGREGSGLA